MALRRLDNASWGFDTNCFVCEPSNPSGLRIPFFHDDEAAVVVAELNLGEPYSGAPRYVHGGVVLAVLDEAMAWAAIALAHRFAVVRETSARFHRPVKVGRPHRVEASVGRGDDSVVEAEAAVIDGSGRRCAEARATLAVLSPATARSAIGDVPQAHAGYLRRRPSPPR